MLLTANIAEQGGREQHAALAAWRQANPLDVVRIIREVRDEEERAL